MKGQANSNIFPVLATSEHAMVNKSTAKAVKAKQVPKPTSNKVLPVNGLTAGDNISPVASSSFEKSHSSTSSDDSDFKTVLRKRLPKTPNTKNTKNIDFKNQGPTPSKSGIGVTNGGRIQNHKPGDPGKRHGLDLFKDFPMLVSKEGSKQGISTSNSYGEIAQHPLAGSGPGKVTQQLPIVGSSNKSIASMTERQRIILSNVSSINPLVEVRCLIDQQDGPPVPISVYGKAPKNVLVAMSAHAKLALVDKGQNSWVIPNISKPPILFLIKWMMSVCRKGQNIPQLDISCLSGEQWIILWNAAKILGVELACQQLTSRASWKANSFDFENAIQAWSKARELKIDEPIKALTHLLHQHAWSTYGELQLEHLETLLKVAPEAPFTASAISKFMKTAFYDENGVSPSKLVENATDELRPLLIAEFEELYKQRLNRKDSIRARQDSKKEKNKPNLFANAEFSIKVAGKNQKAREEATKSFSNAHSRPVATPNPVKKSEVQDLGSSSGRKSPKSVINDERLPEMISSSPKQTSDKPKSGNEANRESKDTSKLTKIRSPSQPNQNFTLKASSPSHAQETPLEVKRDGKPVTNGEPSPKTKAKKRSGKKKPLASIDRPEFSTSHTPVVTHQKPPKPPTTNTVHEDDGNLENIETESTTTLTSKQRKDSSPISSLPTQLNVQKIASADSKRLDESIKPGLRMKDSIQVSEPRKTNKVSTPIVGNKPKVENNSILEKAAMSGDDNRSSKDIRNAINKVKTASDSPRVDASSAKAFQKDALVDSNSSEEVSEPKMKSSCAENQSRIQTKADAVIRQTDVPVRRINKTDSLRPNEQSSPSKELKTVEKPVKNEGHAMETKKDPVAQNGERSEKNAALNQVSLEETSEPAPEHEDTCPAPEPAKHEENAASVKTFQKTEPAPVIPEQPPESKPHSLSPPCTQAASRQSSPAHRLPPPTHQYEFSKLFIIDEGLEVIVRIGPWASKAAIEEFESYNKFEDLTIGQSNCAVVSEPERRSEPWDDEDADRRFNEQLVHGL